MFTACAQATIITRFEQLDLNSDNVAASPNWLRLEFATTPFYISDLDTIDVTITFTNGDRLGIVNTTGESAGNSFLFVYSGRDNLPNGASTTIDGTISLLGISGSVNWPSEIAAFGSCSLFGGGCATIGRGGYFTDSTLYISGLRLIGTIDIISGPAPILVTDVYFQVFSSSANIIFERNDALPQVIPEPGTLFLLASAIPGWITYRLAKRIKHKQ